MREWASSRGYSLSEADAETHAREALESFLRANSAHDWLGSPGGVHYLALLSDESVDPPEHFIGHAVAGMIHTPRDGDMVPAADHWRLVTPAEQPIPDPGTYLSARLRAEILGA